MTNTFTRDPSFGHDPWIGPGEQVTSVDDYLLVAGSSHIYRGADTLTGDIGELPAGLDAYMSYVDGYGGFGELVSRFGHTGALLLSISVQNHPARCADVESGAMSAQDLPNWLDHLALTDGGKQLPWVYTNAGNMSECNAFIGDRHVVRWSAHVGFGPHICGPGTCGYPQADWTQWIFNPNGLNIDLSVGTYMPAPPPPPDPNHYKWYYGKFRVEGLNLNERDTVEEYDRRRKNPRLNKKRLGLLEWHAGLLADRIWTVAHQDKEHGKPSWNKFHRGWRFQQLWHRSKGEQVAK